MNRRLAAASTTVVAALAVPVAPAAAAPVTGTDRLTAGRCLTWTPRTFSAELGSPSGRFSLWLGGATLALENEVATPSGGHASDDVWRMDLNRRGRSASLCMRRDGNLTWRVDGRAAWSSRTRGAGNTARLLDSGSLVVRNARGRTLWSSGTTAVLLRAGDALASGRTLVSRQYRSGSSRRPAISTRLSMTRGGDLVLRTRAKRVWHSNTHVRGSHLALTGDGRAVVRAPDGRTLWHSPAVGGNGVLRVAGKGKLTLHAGRRCWVRPAHAGDCYTG